MDTQTSRILNAIYAGTLLGQTAVTVGGSVIVLHAMDLGADLLQVGLVSSAGTYVALALRMPMGLISDRLGRRRVYLLGMASFGLSALVYALATTPLVLIVGRLAEGVGWSTFMSLGLTLVSDVSSDPNAVRRYTLFSGAGLLLGPALSTLLLAFSNVRGLFYVSLAVWFVVLTITWLYVHEVGKGTSGVSPRGNFTGLLKKRSVLAVILSNVGFSFVNIAVNTYSPIYAVDVLGLSKQLVAGLSTVRASSMILLRFMSGRIMAKADRKWLLIFVLVDNAVGVAAIGLCTNYLQMVLVTILLGLGWGLIFPVNATLIADGTNHLERNMANAVYMTAGDIVTMAAPFLFTGVARQGLATVFFISPILPLLTAVAVFHVLR